MSHYSPIIIDKRSLKNLKSWVWDDKLTARFLADGKAHIFCRLCDEETGKVHVTVYKRVDSSSNVSKHLRAKHPNVSSMWCVLCSFLFVFICLLIITLQHPLIRAQHAQLGKKMFNQPIEEFMAKKDPSTSKWSMELTSLIVRWIVTTARPYKVVQDPCMFHLCSVWYHCTSDSFLAFLAVLGYLAPWYQMPAKDTFRYKLVPSLYENVVMELRFKLDEARFLHFTSDEWLKKDESCIHSI